MMKQTQEMFARFSLGTCHICGLSAAGIRTEDTCGQEHFFVCKNCAPTEAARLAQEQKNEWLKGNDAWEACW